MSSQKAKCIDGRALSTQPTKTYLKNSLQYDISKQFLTKCQELWETMEPPSNKMQLEFEVWTDL